jgi:hypothetical protein
VDRTFIIKWVPWVLAAAPAVVALALPTVDFRASGAMTLFAVTPAIYFVLLLAKRPWRTAKPALRSLGVAGLFALALLAAGAALGGTESFLHDRFGLFIDVDEYGPRAVIKTPQGYVVLGDDLEGNAVVWLSDDGANWARAPHSSALDDLEIADAAYTRFGILMVGHDEITNAAVALVSPTGEVWERAASLPFGTWHGDWASPKALASRGTKLVAIGSIIGNDSILWYADEPRAWSVGEPAPVFDLGKDPVDVIDVGSRFISAHYDGSSRSAVLFASVSGTTWSEIARFADAEISSLAGYGQGAIAVGFDREKRSAAIWVSPDGAAWTPVPFTETLRDARMDLVVTDGERLFAFGRSLDDDAVIVWLSSDGDEWERLGVSLGDVVIRDAILTEAGMVVVGVDLELDAAALWTSTDGIAYRRVPHDEALFAVR